MRRTAPGSKLRIGQQQRRTGIGLGRASGGAGAKIRQVQQLRIKVGVEFWPAAPGFDRCRTSHIALSGGHEEVVEPGMGSSTDDLAREAIAAGILRRLSFTPVR